jgi:hypothetical protein
MAGLKLKKMKERMKEEEEEEAKSGGTTHNLFAQTLKSVGTFFSLLRDVSPKT